MKGQTIFYGVHRNLKHISVVACILDAGKHMTPFYFFTSQSDGEETAQSEGFRPGVDLILKHRNKLDMSSQLFAECISAVLLSYVDGLR
jgi:hypothetical protein